ncbi:hypothetical protein Cni_G11486 [Canna indica]|uniref:Uncharacterized protein n=1 Tax=Canna indica TaxID=4628 RepID=A0AAQ3K681_9LILI|nr:hypothetical protein Cni_G11486 [Canna indica]
MSASPSDLSLDYFTWLSLTAIICYHLSTVQLKELLWGLEQEAPFSMHCNQPFNVEHEFSGVPDRLL